MGWKPRLNIILNSIFIDSYSSQKSGHELHYAGSFEECGNFINLCWHTCLMSFVNILYTHVLLTPTWNRRSKVDLLVNDCIGPNSLGSCIWLVLEVTYPQPGHTWQANRAYFFCTGHSYKPSRTAWPTPVSPLPL